MLVIIAMFEARAAEVLNRGRGRVEGERELVHRLVSRRFGPHNANQLLPLHDQHPSRNAFASIANTVIECENAKEFLSRVSDV
ncbi:MAG: hypothetical protein OXI76_06530 [Gemmatimonadota bacterium]|nr:hypothetical protein [Gemmatimonadota bacterium]